MAEILRIRDRCCVASCYWLCGVVLPCRVIEHSFFAEAKQRSARLVRGWVTVTDRGLSRTLGFCAKVRVTLTDEWPDDCGDSDLNPTLQGHGRLNIYLCIWTSHNVGMTEYRMTGRHRRTETASNNNNTVRYEQSFAGERLWCIRGEGWSPSDTHVNIAQRTVQFWAVFWSWVMSHQFCIVCPDCSRKTQTEGAILLNPPLAPDDLTNGYYFIIIIMLLDLLARFRPRTINKLSEGDSDARGSGRMNKWITGRPN